MQVQGTDVLSKTYYVPVYNYEYREAISDITKLQKGLHYAIIPCKINEVWFSNDKDGILECRAILSPLADLPEWFGKDDMEEDYMIAFDRPVHELVDNEFWVWVDYHFFEN